MNVAPSATYEAVVETGETGLVGTIKLGLLDNQGAVTSPLDPSGIIETPAGSGIYATTRVAPATGGQYTLLWSLDGSTAPDKVVIDELLVTASAPGDPVPPQDIYATVDELFRILKIRTPTADQTAAGQRVMQAAAGEINAKMGRVDDLEPWQQQLCAEVNLERAVEHWMQEESPFGLVGLDSPTGPTYLPRKSRALAKLLPAQQRWGVG